MKTFVPILLLAGALLGGCVDHRYCLKPQPYQKAGSVPALHGTDGLTVPQSAGALVIPPPPEQRVPFGRQRSSADGKTEAVCLDQPPAMPKPQGNEVTR